MSQASYWTFAVLTTLLAFSVSGCATRQAGYKISEETVAFVEPGVTTKTEVTENMGTPLMDLQDVRVVAYSWGKMRVSATGRSTNQDLNISSTGRLTSYGVQPDPWEEGGLVETERWIYCIAFDDAGKVKRMEKIKVDKPGVSLEQAVRNWAGPR